MVCLSRLSSTNFTWSILEYFVPYKNTMELLVYSITVVFAGSSVKRFYKLQYDVNHKCLSYNTAEICFRQRKVNWECSKKMHINNYRSMIYKEQIAFSMFFTCNLLQSTKKIIDLLKRRSITTGFTWHS